LAGHKKTRDPSEVRRRLLASATQLFAERGFDGVNSNQIARSAAVGVGTFYNHFQDKFEVHQAVVLDALEALRRRIAHSVAGSGGTLEDQVRDLVTSIVGYAETDPARFRVAFGTATAAIRAPRNSRDESNKPGTARAQVGYSTRVTERRLAALQADGLLDSRLHPGVAARAFVAMQNSVVCWWLEDKGRSTREELIETLICLHPAVAGATRD
jgi:AcrR family transcriptional regulator